MTRSRKLLALLALLTLSLPFAACGMREAETGPRAVSLPETPADDPAEKLAWQFLPPEDLTEDPDWKSKIDPDVYTSKIHKNGKLLIQICRTSPADTLAADYRLALKQLNGTSLSVVQGKLRLGDVYNQRFIDRYVKNRRDVRYHNELTSSLFLYATPEEIEIYAKCTEVIRIEVHINGSLEDL